MQILAKPATRERPLAEDVVALDWHASTGPAVGIVGLIPGWGAHPSLYGQQIAALTARGLDVSAPWSLPQDGSTSDAHYLALDDFVLDLRQRGLPVGFVAESLGATYLLASGCLISPDRVVLIAPALLLSARQMFSWRALRDVVSLARSNRVPITTWRLRSISDNPSFLKTATESGLIPPFSSREYVLHAVQASLHAATRPSKSEHMWVIRGARDELLSEAASKFLLRRLASANPRVSVIPNAAHGVLWDTREGSRLAEEIAAFLKPND